MQARTNIPGLSNGKLTRLVLLVVVALLAAACGGDGSGGNGSGGDAESSMLERAKAEGIRIGFANVRPYGFENEQGEPDGEAPAVARRS